MSLPDFYQKAEDLEAFLGDPFDATRPFSFRTIMDADEKERVPQELLEILYQWGLHYFTIPDQLGGKAQVYEQGLSLLRSVARRDPTTVTTLFMSYVGLSPIWVGADEKMRGELSEFLLNGNKISWGISERDHGSDVLANHTTAVRDGDDYILNGEKWMIGNATYGDAITVFARTRDGGGPAGYSIFMFEKKNYPRESFSLLPKLDLLGLRGLDLSGIRFHNCRIPKGTLVGKEGRGLEYAIRGAQLVRTMIANLAQGCADTAMRVTMAFATNRKIFNSAVFEIPCSRALLVESFSDILISDAMMISAVRGLHHATNQFSIWSGIVKYFVPTTLEGVVKDLAVVLGSRFFLRKGFMEGVFQKCMRDIPVCGLADGNTLVNLKSVAHQLDSVLPKVLANMDGTLDEEIKQRLGKIFNPAWDVPQLNPAELSLVSRGRDDIMHGFMESIRLFRAEYKNHQEVDQETFQIINDLADRFREKLVSMGEFANTWREKLGKDYGQSSQLYHLGKQYCLLHAAATCLHHFTYGRQNLPEYYQDGVWLAACWLRLWQRYEPMDTLIPDTVVTRMAEILEDLYDKDRMFSLMPFQLAKMNKDIEL